MKQQVNLYLPELRVKRDVLSVVLMLQILGVAVALMMLLSGFEFVRGYLLQGELDELRTQLAEETRKTGEIDQILAVRTQDVELGNQLRAAESDLEVSRQMQSFFQQRALGNANGFSEHFKDLSRAAISGLWITEFSFSSGGSSTQLRGFAIDSSLVPNYVTRLGRGSSRLVDSQFSVSTSRSSVEGRMFSFELNSTP